MRKVSAAFKTHFLDESYPQKLRLDINPSRVTWSIDPDSSEYSMPFFFDSDYGDICSDGFTFEYEASSTGNIELGSASAATISGKVFNDDGSLANTRIDSCRAYLGVLRDITPYTEWEEDTGYRYAETTEQVVIGGVTMPLRRMWISEGDECIYYKHKDGAEQTLETGSPPVRFIWYTEVSALTNADLIFVLEYDGADYLWEAFIWNYNSSTATVYSGSPDINSGVIPAAFMGTHGRIEGHPVSEIHEIITESGDEHYFISVFDGVDRIRYEMCPMGEFYFDKVNTFSRQIELEGTDGMSKLDVAAESAYSLVGWTNTRFDPVQVSESVCADIGVDFTTDGHIPGHNYYAISAYLPSEYTYRDFFGWLSAVSCGSFALFSAPLPNRRAELVYKSIGQAHVETTIADEMIAQGGLTIESNEYPHINKLIVIDGAGTSLWATESPGDTPYYVNSVVFNANGYGDSLMDMLTALRYATPFHNTDVELVECPIWFEVHEYFKVNNPYDAGTLNKFPLMHIEWEWAGRCRGHVSAVGEYTSNAPEVTAAANEYANTQAVSSAGAVSAPTNLGTNWSIVDGGYHILGGFVIVSMKVKTSASRTAQSFTSVCQIPRAGTDGAALSAQIPGTFNQIECYVDSSGYIRIAGSGTINTNTEIVINGIYRKA